MLKIVFGRAGSGKSDRVMQLLKESAEKNKDTYLIVPRQFTFESDRAKLELLGNEIGNKITVLSFDRIYELLIRTYGKPSGKRLTKSGLKLLMFLALKNCEEKLKIFKKQVGRESFANAILDFSRQIKRQNQTPADFLELADKIEDENLKNKMTEFAICADSFDREVKNAGINPDDDLSRLKKLLEEHKFFENATVAFDGFSGFSNAEMSVVEKIFLQAEDVILCACCDDIYNDDIFNKFSESAKTARDFINLAKRNNIDVATPEKQDGGKRFISGELKLLEEGFLDDNNPQYLENPKDIFINCAEDIYEEVDFVAREIKNLVRKNGYSYSDFLVISRNVSEYGNPVYSTFKKYNIPLFYDTRKSIANQPLILAVSSLMKIIHSGYKNEDIFTYLKSYLSPFEADDIFELENYIYIWDIEGFEKYKNPFYQNPSGYGEKLRDDDKKKLEKINLFRENFVNHIEKLSLEIRNSTSAKKISESLFNFITKNGIKKRAQEAVDKSIKEGNMDEAQVLPMVYDSLIKIFEQLTEIFAGKEITLKKYCEYFDMIAKTDSLATIPSSTEEVTFGEAGKLRPTSPKTVFILGANFGSFPLESSKRDVFTYREKEILKENGLPFGVDPIESMAEEYFIAYTAICAPKEKLYVSYTLFDKAENSRTPSIIISEIKNVFRNIKEGDCKRDSYLSIENPVIALEEFAKEKNKESEYALTLKESLAGIKDSEISHILAMNDKLKESLSKESVAKLYSGNLRLSPSKLELFYDCPFAYFSRYSMRLKSIEKAQLDARNKGTLIHYIFEKMLSEYTADEIKNMDDATLEGQIEKYFKDFSEEHFAGEEMTQKVKWTFKNVLKEVFIFLRSLADELSNSQFTPVAFELSIGDNGDVPPIKLQLPDNSEISLEGKVDRADIMVKDNKRYLRVVDYKTGSKEFKMGEIPRGRDMQMFIYLFSIIENGRGLFKDLIPAGVLYFKAKYSDSTVKPGDKKKKSPHMEGIILRDLDVLFGMDPSGEGKFIKQKFAKKNSNFDSNSVTANLEEFDNIKREVLSNTRKMGERLKSGDISVDPVKRKKYDRCDYCEFKNVCHIENIDLDPKDVDNKWYLIKDE
jgi:ATP-dependent helicase/nuclease subunit B